jgi:hypothetical protein
MSRDIGEPVTAQTQAGTQLQMQSNSLEVADLTRMRKWKLIFVNGSEQTVRLLPTRASQPHQYELTGVLRACFETVEISNT